MLTAHTETLAEGATPPVEGASRANRSPEEFRPVAQVQHGRGHTHTHHI